MRLSKGRRIVMGRKRLDDKSMSLVEVFLNPKEQECKPELYDFTEDCNNLNEKELGLYRKKTGVNKLFEYKTNDKIKDPDSYSKLLQEIYKSLWPDFEKLEFLLQDKIIASDTLTSAWTPVKKYFLKSCYGEEIKKLKIEKRYRQINAELCKKFYESNVDFQNQINKNKDLCDFINLYHTIGNYCPVANGFNSPRSGSFASHDMWDLSLFKIREFYYSQGDKEISDKHQKILDLLHGKYINNVVNWLNCFGEGEQGWICFVNKYFFFDYVDKDYNVVPFCENHSWDNNEINDFDKFFKVVSNRIKRRGLFMVAMLKLATDFSEVYKAVMETLVTQKFDSMECAIQEITKIMEEKMSNLEDNKKEENKKQILEIFERVPPTNE